MLPGTCSTCKFYLAPSDKDPGHRCRRFPPVVMFVGVQKQNLAGEKVLVFPHDANFTPTLPDWTCGEYQAQLAIASH